MSENHSAATAAARAPTPAGPVLSTGRIRLRPITERDGIFLYDLMLSPQSGGRVRFAGATPSPDKVAASLWESVLAQFVVEAISNGEPLGLVAVTSPNFRDGFAYVSGLGTPAVQGTGLIAEAVLLCFHYAFLVWPFRKIYMEATEESFAAFRSGAGTLFHEEGRLLQHSFWNGKYTDLMILAVYRDDWERLSPRFADHYSRFSGSGNGA